MLAARRLQGLSSHRHVFRHEKRDFNAKGSAVSRELTENRSAGAFRRFRTAERVKRRGPWFTTGVPMLRAVLQLLRPANVATALADVLAGFALAGLGNRSALPWLLLATAALYAGGIVLNDVFDRELDRI